MAEEKKTISQQLSDTGFAAERSSALVDKLLKGLEEQVKPPKLEEDGWKLKTITKQTNQTYAGVTSPDKSLANEIAIVKLKMEWEYVRLTGKDDPDNKNNDDPDNDPDHDPVKEPDPIGEKIQEEQFMHEVAKLAGHNHLSAEHEGIEPAVLQNFALSHVETLPNIYMQAQTLFAMQQLDIGNAAFAAQAAEFFELQSGNAELSKQEQQFAKFAQHKIQDPVFVQAIADQAKVEAQQIYSPVPTKLQNITAPRPGATSYGLTSAEQSLAGIAPQTNYVSNAEQYQHAPAEYSAPVSTPAENEQATTPNAYPQAYTPESTPASQDAHMSALSNNGIGHNEQISGPQFQNEYAPIPMSSPMSWFQDNTAMTEPAPSLFAAQPATPQSGLMTAPGMPGSNPFAMPTTLVPGNSFYAALSGGTGGGDGGSSSGGGFSSN